MSRTSIRFEDQHVEPILNDQKDVTLRLGEDWEEVRPGDRLDLLDQEGSCFARATVEVVGYGPARETFKSVRSYPGHRSYPSRGAFFEELRRYYPEKEVGPETRVYEIHLGDVDAKEEYLEELINERYQRRQP